MVNKAAKNRLFAIPPLLKPTINSIIASPAGIGEIPPYFSSGFQQGDDSGDPERREPAKTHFRVSGTKAR